MNAAQNIVRTALASWAEDLMSDVIDPLRVIGGPNDAGDAPTLPTCGIEWGTVEPINEVAEVTQTDTAETWLMQYEEVSLAFVWRTNDKDQSDLIAHEFVNRAAIEAQLSNDSGTRVLHFGVNLGGSEWGAKLYLLGEVAPPQPSDTLTRSLYMQRVPATVVYPAPYVRARTLPEMNVGVTVNGTVYPLPSPLPVEP